MSNSDDCVQVAVRVRPLIDNEKKKGCQLAVEKVGFAQILLQADSFTFNYVFDSEASQENVYKEAVRDIIGKLFKGYNVTILAYGQTGSGKTYTMGTSYDGNLNENTGVIPRAIEDIFEQIEKDREQFKFNVKCSFMELYQEHLFDLLGTGPREQMVIDMREDRSGIVMPGLTEVQVSNSRETTDCLLKGSAGRAVASTAMNQTSSRSHAIFTITIRAESLADPKSVITSKFHLVDLAGSERSKKTKATGDRFKEGVKINQGLLALGNVISALGTNQGVVSYRDSKLTRLLQDSLGGNSITLMIACISPADYNIAESLSTLRYADRARKIKNKPIINQDPHAAEISHLKAVIQKLRLELLDQRCQLNAQTNSDSSSKSSEHSKANQSYDELLENHRNLQQQFRETLNDVAENEMRAHLAEATLEKLKIKTTQIKSIIEDFKTDYKLEVIQETFQKNSDRLENIIALVADCDEDLLKTQTEIFDSKRLPSNNSEEVVHDRSGEMNEVIQEQADVFTNKQIDFNEQLRRINRELSLKEDLHGRVVGNLKKFCTYDIDFDEKYKECEGHIQVLEAEKAELVEMLKSVKQNVSAKLAEERRKRVQTLEEQITELRQKAIQQAKILKLREKEAEKVKNLQTEIQAMKESKVKLIRAMRSESEKFRQWKLVREKEILQLKGKDRKMQNEMARKEVLHTKQRNVLKRKCEEAMAINKRLKEAIERQKVAQSQRKQFANGKDSTSKMEKTMTWIDHELEVILSVVDAEISLEELIEDRAIINARISELKKIDQSSKELESLMEELEMRTAQISDLQQKVISTDIEKRVKAMCDSIQNLPEAKIVLKYLLRVIPETRREYALKIQESKSAKESVEEKLALSEKLAKELEEKLASAEKNNEEKVTLLLDDLKNLRSSAGKKIRKNHSQDIQNSQNQFEEYDCFSDSFLSDAENDPDWVKTPRIIHKRSTRLHKRTKSIDVDISTDEEKKSSFGVGKKRKSEESVMCRCRGDCKTKRCSCRSHDQSCIDAKCRCSKLCQNGKIIKIVGNNDSDGGDIDEGSLESPCFNLANETVTLSKS